MFKTQKAIKKAKKVLKRVKRELLYKKKHSEYHNKDGSVRLQIYLTLSNEEYIILKNMCWKEDIFLLSNWEIPFPAFYRFELKVR